MVILLIQGQLLPFKAANGPKKLVIVPEATQDLTGSGEILFEVFDETLQ
jgi:hypothetical protein